MGECRAHETIPAPWPIITSDDYHRRRPGEPLGYVPQVGDRIRCALRHMPWCPAVSRMLSEEGHDEQQEFGEVLTVEAAFPAGGDEPRTKYTCKDAKGERSWIDLDWWICEQVLEDGALW